MRFSPFLSVLCGLVLTAAAPPPMPVAVKAPPVPAAAVNPAIGTMDQGRTIYIVGELDSGAAARFIRELDAHPKVTKVYLASIGGRVFDGYAIASVVASRGLDTHVEFACWSSCTQIFASGRQRLAGPHAQLGFHRSYRALDADGNPSDNNRYADKAELERKLGNGTVATLGSGGDAMMVRSLRRAGVNDAFLAKVLETSSRGMWIPPLAELTSVGMVSRVAGEGEFQLPPPFDRDRAGLASDLALSAPLWRALRDHQSALFETQVEQVWIAVNSGGAWHDAVEAARVKANGDLGWLIVRLPDPQLERYGALLARQARLEARRDYAGCAAAVAKAPELPLAVESAAVEAESDAVLADALDRGELAREPNSAKARKLVFKQAKLLFGDGRIAIGGAIDDRSNCVRGFQTFAVLDGIEPRRRVPLLRALLVLGEEATAARKTAE